MPHSHVNHNPDSPLKTFAGGRYAQRSDGEAAGYVRHPNIGADGAGGNGDELAAGGLAALGCTEDADGNITGRVFFCKKQNEDGTDAGSSLTHVDKNGTITEDWSGDYVIKGADAPIRLDPLCYRVPTSGQDELEIAGTLETNSSQSDNQEFAGQISVAAGSGSRTFTAINDRPYDIFIDSVIVGYGGNAFDNDGGDPSMRVSVNGVNSIVFPGVGSGPSSGFGANLNVPMTAPVLIPVGGAISATVSADSSFGGNLAGFDISGFDNDEDPTPNLMYNGQPTRARIALVGSRATFDLFEVYPFSDGSKVGWDVTKCEVVDISGGIPAEWQTYDKNEYRGPSASQIAAALGTAMPAPAQLPPIGVHIGNRCYVDCVITPFRQDNVPELDNDGNVNLGQMQYIWTPTCAGEYTLFWAADEVNGGSFGLRVGDTDANQNIHTAGSSNGANRIAAGANPLERTVTITITDAQANKPVYLTAFAGGGTNSIKGGRIKVTANFTAIRGEAYGIRLDNVVTYYDSKTNLPIDTSKFTFVTKTADTLAYCIPDPDDETKTLKVFKRVLVDGTTAKEERLEDIAPNAVDCCK